ncbi:MAG: phosphate ABC transporter permease PstA [Alphaproteobacteria bacterium]|jgi:phosphate transport system permease protein|nr:phosphate ABC transporter permease PstA [Alphaproteobacteria bacterium]MBU2041976.1 phosphate ABC transporter permease PstA [Alphaproteobacteria bacterium]MBU2125130.1 phosphate ABC transporter permease PstA [Alphaproteobacteria bacterium]MBU2207541.1 phosphate ABC transporter permease PstA [Alphaproteobacteria bacterium]MBU2292078.1 phosphate ABC transporter permease PstA [Alphaproteobacteria bacterium]
MTETPVTPNMRAERLRAGLKRRYAREGRFKLYGLLAIGVAVGFLLLLLGRIFEQGHTAFYAHTVTVPVYMDPARVDRAYPQGTNFELLVAEQQLARFGVVDDEAGTQAMAMRGLFSSELKFVAAERIAGQPDLIGQTVPIAAPVSDDADLYLKGEMSRDTPADQRRLSNVQLDWLDRMKASGQVASHFNSGLFTKGDSTEPELAGVLGAVVGSALMLLVTAFIAIPLGVGAALYLEEFAPRGRITDLIEVNINNLAAVPSIIYGLLGLALFINWMHLPRASPLVGGLVLALMALPTIIIATRSSLKAVPPSIREAALAMGASRTQTVFQHTLPLAMPGVMTGAIISMAHALGETAPLLLIGMVSFIPGIPTALGEPTGALPSLIYIWENASERAFHERTAAAILVLLAFMIVMNAAAIFLRRRFERRW